MQEREAAGGGEAADTTANKEDKRAERGDIGGANGDKESCERVAIQGALSASVKLVSAPNY